MLRFTDAIVRNFNSKSSLFRVLSANIMFIFCAIALILINNSVIRQSMEREIIEANNNYLEYVSRITDTYFDEVNNILVKYMGNVDINYITNSDTFSGEVIIRLLHARDSISKVKQTIPIISDIWFYFNRIGLVLTTNGTFFVNENFVKTISKYTNNKNYYQVIPSGELVDVEQDIVWRTDRQNTDIKYLEKITFLYHAAFTNSNFSLLVSIDNMALCNILYNSNLKNKNIVLMIDNSIKKLIASNIGIENCNIDIAKTIKDISNEKVLQQGKKVKYGDKEYVITYFKSGKNSMTYAALFPADDIVERVRVIDRNTVYILIVFFIIGSIVIYFLNILIGTPMKKLLKSLSGSENTNNAGKNEFDIINSRISEINEMNRKSTEIIRTQNTLIEEVYLNRLVNNYIGEIGNEITGKLNGKFRRFIAAVLVAEGEPEELTGMVKNEFTRYLSNCFKYQYIFESGNTMGFLVNIDSGSDYSAIIGDIMKSTARDSIYSACGISNVYSDILQAGRANGESRHALLYRKAYDRRLVFDINEIRTDGVISRKGVRISLNDESILINNIFNGNMEGIDHFFSNRKLFNESDTFIQQRELFTYLMAILGIVINSRNISYEDLLKKAHVSYDLKIAESYDLFAISKYVTGMFEAVTRIIKEGTRSIDRYMLEYVENNYNRSMCLDLLAEKLEMSPVYVSKYFKKVTGENFVMYVNKLKIKKAKELLEGTDKILRDISLETGFNDIKYFIKIFKEYEGLTPGDYRKTFNR